jgi:hypothetical protein
LHGTIGQATLCAIHPQRSTVCREFAPAWENGEPNERCDKARAAHGLPPLTPGDWRRPTEPEHPDHRPDNSPPDAPEPGPARLDPAA